MKYVNLFLLVIGFFLYLSNSYSQVPANNPVDTNRNAKLLYIRPIEPAEYFFDSLFKVAGGILDSIRYKKDELNVRIIFTQIDRGANGFPALTYYYFNKSNNRYFYPASSVKLPMALITLQKLNELKAKGITRNSTMITEVAYAGQSSVYNDPNTAKGKPSISQYLKRMLLVSDNDAFNRLYEFAGQEYINDQLQQKGYKDARILQHLGIFLTEDQNRHTNPINFYDSANRLVYAQPMLFNNRQYEKRNDSIGKAYYSNDVLINKAMNFSNKNKISLDDLHTMMVGLIFPEKIATPQRFNITEEDRNFLLKYMSEFPGESVYPFYDSLIYDDAFTKYFLFEQDSSIKRTNIREFNKSGEGYGQLTDIAYIVDYEKHIEFFVSATIYCNANGILNDDVYDYEKTGYPFFEALGKVLYKRELNRKKNILPDLSDLKFTYDK